MSQEFDHFLASRVAKFVPLADAIAGRGDALTIDDATCAAFAAALLARSHGHEVTLFVNPGNVANGEDYYFHVVDSRLDNTKTTEIQLEHTRLPIRTFPDKKRTRKLLRHVLSTLDKEGRVRLLSNVLDQLGGIIPLPTYLRTLSPEEIYVLVRAGVSIENHGWDHAHYSCYPQREVINQIKMARDWLIRELNVPVRYFAVPFGDVLPPKEKYEELYLEWFLLSKTIYSGRVGPAAINRISLNINE